MNPFLEGIKGLRPDLSLTVSEWADTYRILPSKGASEPGRYRTARAPFLREIMDKLSPSDEAKRIVFMKSSQIGGTEMGINFLGAIIHLYPAPTLVVMPTIDLAEKYSKQRIAPMIEETPELQEIVAPARTRDSGNSILLKEFRGGVVMITGSNSATGLRSMPIKYLICSEISAFEKDVGNEGDPVSLAEKRTQTFSRRKVYLESTPTIKDECRIEHEYLKSDQRRYFVPCPECGEFQHLKFKQLKWIDNDPKTARYECEFCTHQIEEWHKTDMLAAGKWQATATATDDETIGYHINALYSPIGWMSWAQIVKEFLESKADAPRLKTFVNTILGETFEEDYAAKVGAEGLKARIESYEPNTVPARAVMITAGVDVQDNRFAVSLYAWGRDEESWIISHQEIFGDPSKQEIWKQLDDVVLRKYDHELGGELPVSVVAIDTGGHYTHEVYQYVRERRGKAPNTFVLAVKGQSQKNKPAIGKATRVDVNYKNQTIKSGAELYPVGTDTIKSVIYGRFKFNEVGPGYYHFHSELTDEFFVQLTSEKLSTKYVRGFPIREWILTKGKRNEALDCAVYAYAGLQFYYTRYNRKTIWDQLEARLNIKVGPAKVEQVKELADDHKPAQDIKEIKAPPQPALQMQRPSRNISINRRGRGWVSGY